jgi:hypothetical protein
MLPKNLMAMFSKTFLIFLLAIVLSGCGGLPIPSDVPDELETLRLQVTPGQTSRHEVQEILGQPFISSERWPVEVYHARTGRDVTVGIVVIPVWIDTEEVIVYALVVYDENDVVISIDWDVYEEHSVHFGGGSEWRSALLEAGDYYFAAAKEGAGRGRKEILLARVSENQRALHTRPPPGKCAVLFFFYDPDYKKKFYIDGERIGETPLLISTNQSSLNGVIGSYNLNLNVFSKALVSEGKHELRVTTSFKPREFSRKFICEQERIFYVYPQLERIKTKPWGFWRKKYKYKGEIAIHSEPLESHDGWRRLLFYNGKWLGED